MRPLPADTMPESAHIRFILDGAVHHAPCVDPNTTVLSYLRDELGRRGTKEGCAEGDCGACTVVASEPGADGQINYRPINACIALLASVDGRELLTVESLAQRRGALHPVQRAMVEHHGSQCGFCTPGIVMSLFALYKQRDALTRKDIDECLAGNLCRCTGYRPIVDAGLAMHDIGRNCDEHTRLTGLPGTVHADDAQLHERLTTLARSARFHGPTLAGDAVRIDMPTALDAALAVLREHPEATVVAGGTDLGLLITKSHQSFSHLLHVGRVGEMRGITRKGAVIRIGAATPLEDVYQALRGTWPPLDELWSRFASPPIRHAATLGGNIANASPIGDSMPALMALDAQLELASHDGGTHMAVRRVSLCDFYTGYRQSRLQPGELIVAIEVPVPAPDARYRVRKVAKRYDQDISALCVALHVTLADGRIDNARLAFGGMAATPARAVYTEQVLQGATLGDDLDAAVRAALAQDFQPISDFRASAAYRLQVAGNVVNHFLWQLANEAKSHGGEVT